jgi:hypothetical protein
VRRKNFTVASPSTSAAHISPCSTLRLGAHDHEVAVEHARLDHRLAADGEHEQLAVADELLGEREDGLDALVGEDRRAGRDLTDERDVAARARDASTGW